MPHRGLRIAQWVALLFSALAAFWYVAALDGLGVAGAREIVLVSDSDRTTSSQDTVAAIEQVAGRHDAAIAWWIPDLRDPQRVRHLYVAADPSSPIAQWLTDGYPWFSRDMVTTLHPLDEASRMDPQGHYVVFGDPSAAEDLTTTLEGLGYRCQVREYYTARSMLGWASTQPSTTLLGLVALFVVTLVGADVLTRTRAYGVQRLQGAGFARLLRRDLASVARSGLLAAASVGGAAVGFLAWYNGLHQVGTWALLAAGFAVAFGLLGLATHAAALLLACRVTILDAVKGRMPAGGMIGAAYAVRFAATLAALSLATATLAGVADVRRAAADSSVWAAASDASFAQFSGDLAEAETEGLVVRAGRWLAEEMRSGEAVLVHKDVFNSGGIAPPTAPRLASLLVDQGYLDLNPVRLAGGSLAHARPDEVQVLLPAARAADLPLIEGLVAEWAADAARRAGAKEPQVTASVLAPGQRLFTYGTTNTRAVEAFYDDPLLIVADSGLSIVAADDAMAVASQGGIVLLDQQQAISSSDAAGLRTFVVAFSPVALRAQERAAELARDLQIRTFGLWGALALLAAAGWGLAELQVRRAAQALFARAVHGWSFWRAHALTVAVEVLAGGALAGCVAGRSLAALAEASASPFVPPEVAARLPLGGWEPLAALGIAVLSAGVFLASAARLTRRLVRHHASEA